MTEKKRNTNTISSMMMAPLRKRSRTKTHKNTNLPEHNPEELDNMSPSQYEHAISMIQSSWTHS